MMTKGSLRRARATAAGWLLVAAIACLVLGPAMALAQTETATDTTGVPDMTLEGGREGTVLRSLTVEGENQVEIQFDRPTLAIDLDPADVPGLEWDRALEVLDRQRVDLLAPLVRRSASERCPYLARPWLDGFKSGAVARFHPDVSGVARWSLSVASSRGETVASFEGKGKPPAEITWDGRTLAGTPAAPGLTYSYVFEAYDEAGNKRNFVGEGFQIGPYRLATATGIDLMLPGEEIWKGAFPSHRQATLAPPLLLEAASWLNQLGTPEQPIRVAATARTFQQAQKLAESARESLATLLIGDPARLRVVTDVRSDAPQQGILMVSSTSE